MNGNLEQFPKDIASGVEMDKLKKLVSTEDGMKVQEMLKNSNIEQAAKSGDIDALKNAVSQLLKTDAGAKLASQLSEMMK